MVGATLSLIFKKVTLAKMKHFVTFCPWFVTFVKFSLTWSFLVCFGFGLCWSFLTPRYVGGFYPCLYQGTFPKTFWLRLRTCSWPFPNQLQSTFPALLSTTTCSNKLISSSDHVKFLSAAMFDLRRTASAATWLAESISDNQSQQRLRAFSIYQKIPEIPVGM